MTTTTLHRLDLSWKYDRNRRGADRCEGCRSPWPCPDVEHYWMPPEKWQSNPSPSGYCGACYRTWPCPDSHVPVVSAGGRDERWEWVEVRRPVDREPTYIKGRCNHLTPIPVESLTGEVVARLCPDCDAQLLP